MLKPVVTAPTDLPVTLDELKAQTVVDFSEHDTMLTSFLQAATHHLDGPAGILGRAIMSQVVVQKFHGFENVMRLPYGLASSISEVAYFDESDVAQVITGWALHEDGSGSYLKFPSDTVFPGVYERDDAISVTYTAGWGGAASVPGPIKLAIKMLAATWYENRETVKIDGISPSEIPFSVKSLIAPFRRVGL